MSIIRQNQSSHLQLRDSADVYIAALNSLRSAIANRVNIYVERSNSRHLLATMNTKMLDDIGVSPSEARLESEKPFWKS